MIPKIIHYVWLGNAPLPEDMQKCMDSWKKWMPEYQLIKWDDEAIRDIESVFVREALMEKKWAFASDVIRLYAIHKYGGIYMDTDVMVYKSLDEFLNFSFFTSVENHPTSFEVDGMKMVDENGYPKDVTKEISGMGLLAALYGAEKGNPFIKECLDYFGCRHFINPDGSLHEDEINPGIMAKLLVKHGFRYVDKKQALNGNMMIYPSNVFAGDSLTRDKDSYAMHFMDNSWKEKNFKWWLKDYVKAMIPWLFRK